MEVKAKVVYDFQSIEFDYEINTEEDLNNFFSTYKNFLEGLKHIGDEIPNPNKNSKKEPKKEDMITPAQINFLESLGIPKEEAQKLTKKQAYLKIKELS